MRVSQQTLRLTFIAVALIFAVGMFGKFLGL
jgi:hypothetical protein